MTDYQDAVRRTWARRTALALVSHRVINPLAVRMARSFLPPELRRRVPVLGCPAILNLPDGDVELRNVDRCQVAKDVYWSEGQLPGSAERLALSMAVELSKEADVFLDIGSYTGLFAIAVAKANPSITAHAFEILPENFQFLWQNVFANNLVQRVIPHLTGIGDQDGSLSAPYSFGMGVLPSAVAIDSVAAGGVTVPIRPLDDIFGSFEGRMVWKIDVEGFEWPVFMGGRELVARCRPDIVCEVLVNAPHVEELTNFLAEMSYHIYHIREDGLHHRSAISPSHDGRDWFLSPRPPEDLSHFGWPIAT